MRIRQRVPAGDAPKLYRLDCPLRDKTAQRVYADFSRGAVGSKLVGTTLRAFAHPVALLRRNLPWRRRRVDEVGGQLRIARLGIRNRFLLDRAVAADSVGQ
jgi:hypothetical protein